MTETSTPAPRTYAKIERIKIRETVFFNILIKTTDDIRRYPSRTSARHASKTAAVKAAEESGAIVIKNWYEVELTAEESAAQYS